MTFKPGDIVVERCSYERNRANIWHLWRVIEHCQSGDVHLRPFGYFGSYKSTYRYEINLRHATLLEMCSARADLDNLINEFVKNQHE